MKYVTCSGLYYIATRLIFIFLNYLQEASDSVTERPHFYVYCMKPCATVTVGKLRVRCSTCKQGAVTLLSDPSCWGDVLTQKKASIFIRLFHPIFAVYLSAIFLFL